MAIGQKNIVDLGKPESKASGSSAPKDTAKPKTTPTGERELKGRIAACFDRIAAAAEARGDGELAEVIREDTVVMANGLTSLTRPFRALRAPLLLVLGIIEPVMAFSRITRLLLERFLLDRALRRAERDDPTQQPPTA